MGSGTSLLISLFMGYVIFSLTPKIADIIRDTLKIPAFKYGGAIGEPVGYALGMGKSLFGVAQQGAIGTAGESAITYLEERFPRLRGMTNVIERGLVASKMMAPRTPGTGPSSR